ncbi:MAG: sigma-70 family RNA polymerase sigma factor [Phycisphaerae bacterium]|nr:sigma-70 family RNA polymerase sigma factor [Phycisphaerae bacterium]
MAESQRNEWLGSDAVRAAAEVFNTHGGFIRAVIRFQAHNKSEEDDLFQEFFLALIRKPVPADVRNIKSYLYRAVVNHILDSVRMRENYRRLVRKYMEETGIPINNCLAGNVFIIEDAEEKDAVVAYFARYLQEREAQAFVLRYRDNFSVGEIAAKMGVNVRTVSRYLSEGLRRLRKTLAT